MGKILNYSNNEQIGSIFHCACLKIDHRWRQNMIRTKKCHRCSCNFFMSLVISDTTTKWNLFVSCNKETKCCQWGDVIYVSVTDHNCEPIKLHVWFSPKSKNNSSTSFSSIPWKDKWSIMKQHNNQLELINKCIHETIFKWNLSWTVNIKESCRTWH